MSNHTNADDQSIYREAQDIQDAKDIRDPLLRFEQQMLAQGITAEELAAIRAAVQTQLAAAEADRALQASEFENARELLTYKATSPLQVEVAENELKQAQARYEIEKLRVAGCRILAPYSGRVVQVLTNEHETINRRTELLSILSDARLEIELIVPSSWLGWLQTGHALSFRVDETGATYPATVMRVGAMVDPVSQTAQVVAAFDETNRDVRPGMSGDAMFSAKP